MKAKIIVSELIIVVFALLNVNRISENMAVLLALLNTLARRCLCRLRRSYGIVVPWEYLFV